MLLISCRCIHITQAVSAIFFLPVPFHMKHAMRHIRQLRITELRFRNLKIIACKTALSVISGIPCRNFRMNRLHAVDDKMYLMIAGRKSSYFSSPYSWLLLRNAAKISCFSLAGHPHEPHRVPPDRILPCRHCTLLRPVWSLDISLPVSPAHPFQTGSAGVPDQKRASAPPCSGRTAVFHPGGAPCSMQMLFLPQSLRHKTEAAQNLSDSFSRHAIHDSLHILSLRKAFLIRAVFLQISSIPREISSSLLPQEKNTTSGFFCLIRADPLCVIKRYPGKHSKCRKFIPVPAYTSCRQCRPQ